MKSRITIEVDFENGNKPIIQILQASSDDVRDSLVKNFTEQVSSSSWLKLQWKDGIDQFNRIHITPLPPEELKVEAEIMLEQFKLYEDWQKDQVAYAGVPPVQ